MKVTVLPIVDEAQRIKKNPGKQTYKNWKQSEEELSLSKLQQSVRILKKS